MSQLITQDQVSGLTQQILSPSSNCSITYTNGRVTSISEIINGFPKVSTYNYNPVGTINTAIEAFQQL